MTSWLSSWTETVQHAVSEVLATDHDNNNNNDDVASSSSNTTTKAITAVSPTTMTNTTSGDDDKTTTTTTSNKKTKQNVVVNLFQTLTFQSEELRSEWQKTTASSQLLRSTHDDFLLPWETHDKERDILVEECREAILQLSHHKETFFGPFPLPPMNARIVDDDNDHDHHDDMEEVNFTNHDHPEKNMNNDPESTDLKMDATNTKTKKKKKFERDMMPSTESLEHLRILEPLPYEFHYFHVQDHVPCIECLLTQHDPQLVTMQAQYSGGGERENIFWKNYFFHCTYTRYTMGLSIDEIWSHHHDKNASSATATTAAASVVTNAKESVSSLFHQWFDPSRNAPGKNDDTHLVDVSNNNNLPQAPTPLREQSQETIDHDKNQHDAAAAVASSEESSSSGATEQTYEMIPKVENATDVEIPTRTEKSETNAATTTTTTSAVTSSRENQAATIATTTTAAAVVASSTMDTSHPLDTINDDLYDNDNNNNNGFDDDDLDQLLNDDDYELDELEAEIARELND